MRMYQGTAIVARCHATGAIGGALQTQVAATVTRTFAFYEGATNQNIQVGVVVIQNESAGNCLVKFNSDLAIASTVAGYNLVDCMVKAGETRTFEVSCQYLSILSLSVTLEYANTGAAWEKDLFVYGWRPE